MHKPGNYSYLFISRTKHSSSPLAPSATFTAPQPHHQIKHIHQQVLHTPKTKRYLFRHNSSQRTKLGIIYSWPWRRSTTRSGSVRIMRNHGSSLSEWKEGRWLKPWLFLLLHSSMHVVRSILWFMKERCRWMLRYGCDFLSFFDKNTTWTL